MRHLQNKSTNLKQIYFQHYRLEDEEEILASAHHSKFHYKCHFGTDMFCYFNVFSKVQLNGTGQTKIHDCEKVCQILFYLLLSLHRHYRQTRHWITQSKRLMDPEHNCASVLWIFLILYTRAFVLLSFSLAVNEKVTLCLSCAKMSWFNEKCSFSANIWIQQSTNCMMMPKSIMIRCS